MLEILEDLELLALLDQVEISVPQVIADPRET